MKGQKGTWEDVISSAILIVGVILIGLILILILRVQRGLIGIILSGVTIALFVYWLREARRMIRRPSPLAPAPQGEEWIYDVVEKEDILTVIAEVPGPEKKIKTRLTGNVLEITGGQGFRGRISLSSDAEIFQTSYANGVLTVKLRKIMTAR